MAAIRGSSRSAPENPAPRPSRRASHVGAFLLILSGIFFSVNFAQEWWVSHQVQAQVTQLKQQIAQQNATNAQLADQYTYMKSKAYTVAIARKNGLAFPGDKVMYVQQPAPHIIYHHATAPAPAPEQNIIVKLLSAIFR